MVSPPPDLQSGAFPLGHLPTRTSFQLSVANKIPGAADEDRTRGIKLHKPALYH